MKKINTLLAISALQIIAPAYAGEMGPVSTTGSRFAPFVSLEGTYTWNSMHNGVISGVESNEKLNHWGGRVAGGAAFKYTDVLKFSGEMGWGSYGYSKFSTLASGESANYYINGFDLLLGAIYTYNRFDFFAKAGALIENREVDQQLSLQRYYPGGLVQGQSAASQTYTGVLPEVKIGAEFNYNEHLGISLAYMYAFGANGSYTSANSATPGNITINQSIRGQTPTLNSLMLGLRYYI